MLTMVLEIDSRYQKYVEENLSNTIVNNLIYLQKIYGKFTNCWAEYDDNGFVEIQCETLDGLHLMAKEIRLLERFSMNNNPETLDYVSPRTQNEFLRLMDEMDDDMLEFQDEASDLVYGMLETQQIVPPKTKEIYV